MSICKAFFSILILLFILLASIRNAVWMDDISIWHDAAKKSPDKPRPHNNLGGYYLFRNDIENAVKEFKEAIRLKPASVEALSNLGFAYYDMGLLKDALALQEQALGIDPNFRNAHYGYAVIMEKMGDYRRAKQAWEMVMRLSKNDDKWAKKAKEHIENITQKSKVKSQN